MTFDTVIEMLIQLALRSQLVVVLMLMASDSEVPGGDNEAQMHWSENKYRNKYVFLEMNRGKC